LNVHGYPLKARQEPITLAINSLTNVCDPWQILLLQRLMAGPRIGAQRRVIYFRCQRQTPLWALDGPWRLGSRLHYDPIDHKGLHVGFTPESRHVQCTSRCPLWAKSGHACDACAHCYQPMIDRCTNQSSKFAKGSKSRTKPFEVSKSKIDCRSGSRKLCSTVIIPMS
jgi:hypothetical protein